MKICVFAYLFLIICFPLSGEDITVIIQDYPMYRELERNEELSRQFLQYIEWCSDKSPDGEFVFSLIKNQVKTLDAISTIFHEKVEFCEWLKLGHRFEDIMTIEYYQKHYLEVYPIAHRKAIIEEINLLKFFAQKKGLPNLSEVVYNLTSPLIEHYNIPVSKIQRRIKFNLEYLAQVRFLNKGDIESAMSLYETGGCKYKDKQRIISEALEVIKESLNEK